MFKREAIFFLSIFILYYSGIISCMPTNDIIYYISYGINNSPGAEVMPLGYTPVENIEYMLEKSGLPIPNFSNEFAALYNVKDVYRVSSVLADSKWDTEFGEIIGPVPVAWFGSAFQTLL